MTQSNARERRDHLSDRSFGGSEHDERAAASAHPWWKRWNPLWGWAVLGAIALSAVILGMLFGGDGGYS